MREKFAVPALSFRRALQDKNNLSHRSQDVRSDHIPGGCNSGFPARHGSASNNNVRLPTMHSLATVLLWRFSCYPAQHGGVPAAAGMAAFRPQLLLPLVASLPLQSATHLIKQLATMLFIARVAVLPMVSLVVAVVGRSIV